MRKTCPVCGEPAISFLDWGRGFNAFRTTCRWCEAELVATRGTWIAFMVCIAVFVGFMISMLLVDPMILKAIPQSLFLLLLILLLTVCAMAGWLAGGYRAATQEVAIEADLQHPDGPASRFRLWVVIGVLVAALGFVPAVLVTMSYRDLILLPFGETTDAVVIELQQGPPVLRREGDWKLRYSFEHAAKTYQGEDTLPPAKVDPEIKSVTVSYWPRSPEVSRVASQVSWTPVRALVILLLFLGGSNYYWLKDRGSQPA